MVNDEKKKAILELNRYIYGKNLCKDDIVDYLGIIFNLIEKQSRELEQEKNKINTIKKLMAVGDITDEALFTLVQTTMAELGRLEDIEEQLDKENEKNKSLKKQIKEMQEYYKNADFIFKDKIKEIVDEHIPKQQNIITEEIEYTPNTNANSFLVQDILKLLEYV